MQEPCPRTDTGREETAWCRPQGQRSGSRREGIKGAVDGEDDARGEAMHGGRKICVAHQWQGLERDRAVSSHYTRRAKPRAWREGLVWARSAFLRDVRGRRDVRTSAPHSPVWTLQLGWAWGTMSAFFLVCDSRWTCCGFCSLSHSVAGDFLQHVYFVIRHNNRREEPSGERQRCAAR